MFLAATSSSKSDDVTLSACLLVCHLIFLAVNFAPLPFAPLHLYPCIFSPPYHCTFRDHLKIEKKVEEGEMWPSEKYKYRDTFLGLRNL